MIYRINPLLQKRKFAMREIMNKIYLDYNATSPLRPAVKQAYIEALDIFGNPSSVHSLGREARKMMEDMRQKLAFYCGVAPRNIIFTASATEANHLILRGTQCDALIIPADEHDSVLNAAVLSGKIVYSLKLTEDGEIDKNHLEAICQECQEKSLRPLISVMKVNNETGRIKDLRDIAIEIRSIGGIIHSDAVQALGKIGFDAWSWQTDAMTLSAHKAGGAKGVGVLVLRDNIVLEPLLTGGGQEMRRRAGTENIPAIMMLGSLLNEIRDLESEAKRLLALQHYLETEIQKIRPESVIVAQNAERVANVSCIMTPYVPSEKQVIMADLAGICVSAGSACSSGKVKKSHVLTAYGYPQEWAGCSLRVSFGFATTQADIDAFLKFYRTLG